MSSSSKQCRCLIVVIEVPVRIECGGRCGLWWCGNRGGWCRVGCAGRGVVIGSGVAQAAPLVSAPTDGMHQPRRLQRPEREHRVVYRSSLFGGSAALALMPAGPGWRSVRVGECVP